MIHATAEVAKSKIGKNTKVLEFAVLSDESEIGAYCTIGSHCVIEKSVVIGNHVTVKPGAVVLDGTTIGDRTFIGANASISVVGRAGPESETQGRPPTHIRAGAWVGANSIVSLGVTIGTGAVVEAGSVVTTNVPPGAVVGGNPASVRRYVDSPGQQVSANPHGTSSKEQIVLGDVRWIELTGVSDVRGELTVAQWNQHFPFKPRRAFFVYGVPSTKVRGEHAHRVCEQVLVALTGSVRVVVDNSHERRDVLLDDSNRALLVPAGVWATQYSFSSDCVMAVFASHEYDESDYIRDYQDFLEYRNNDSIS